MTDLKQTQRLDALVEAFKQDSEGYRDIPTPADPQEKRDLLRALMNIRAPRPLPEETLRLQDEYLHERAEEKGIVDGAALPTARETFGSRHACADRISLWQGDITRLSCDAIVNAANSQMLGCFAPLHACIDNCIHTFAGTQLRAECNRQMRLLRAKYGSEYEQPTAAPMLTDAYNLPAKKIVHIVGPIVSGKLTPLHEQLLADCYQNTLNLCRDNELKSVAFCCISTGVFGFPQKRAAEIAVKTVTEWLSEHKMYPMRVIFNVFKEADRAYYEALLTS